MASAATAPTPTVYPAITIVNQEQAHDLIEAMSRNGPLRVHHQASLRIIGGNHSEHGHILVVTGAFDDCAMIPVATHRESL